MVLLAEPERAEAAIAKAVLRLRARQTATAGPEAPRTVLGWARRYRQIDGQPFSLERFSPLKAVYQDDHPHMVVWKPAQRGASEWAINVALFALTQGTRAWAPEKDGLNVGYIFPTQRALGDFSKERLSGLKNETPYLASLFGSGDFDDVTFKQIGRSYLYLRGGWSESALRSFAADLLVLDEFDAVDPQAIALARRRLNASTVRREVDISTPSLPGKGIHALYLASDQREYEQRCPDCGIWSTYDFFRDVCVDGKPYETWKTWDAERLLNAEAVLACPACGIFLTGAERCAEGRWVARAPEVTSLRGYHIPWWPFPFVSLNRLAAAAVSEDPSEIQEFYRSDLGLPYQPGSGGISEEMLHRLGAELPGGQLPAGPWQLTTMGIDVGARFHYRVSSIGPGGFVYVRAMGAARSWDELDQIMARFGVVHCVVDALPELHTARQWAAKYPGRVLRAFYPGNATALRSELYRVDEDLQEVQINRTMAMDAVLAIITRMRERWPAAVHNDPEVIAHMTAPVRVITSDAHGQPRATWVHTSPDHHFHDVVYDLVARATLRIPQPMAAAVGGDRAGVWKTYQSQVARYA